MPLRVNSATSKQKVTDWPKPAGHWWRSVSHQRCTKISGWALLLLLLAQCCSAFRSKTFCIETKALVASPIVTAMKQKLSLWTHVQFCNSAWEVFLKSHITPEKEASSCAGVTTVHHKLSVLAFPWVPIQVQFYFLSSLLLFLFITSPTFFFPFLEFGCLFKGNDSRKSSILTVPYSSGRPVLTITVKTKHFHLLWMKWWLLLTMSLCKFRDIVGHGPTYLTAKSQLLDHPPVVEGFSRIREEKCSSLLLIFFGQAPSEWWGFVCFGLCFEGVCSFISSWLSSLIQLLCKLKSSFPSMSSEILKLWGCCSTNWKEDPWEEKPRLKLTLCEPRHRLACCRKEETSHYLGAGSQCVGVSSSCSTRTVASLR